MDILLVQIVFSSRAPKDVFMSVLRKVRSYGDLFREGDAIGVKLNMDLGTLRFSRNGHDLGVAVQGLEGVLYPAISLYNR